MIIAIDGPAGAGKSTTARLVAERLNFLYIDTGAMYRAAALAFLRSEREATVEEARALLPEVTIDLVPAAEGMRVLLNGEDVTEEIRRSEVGEAASRVSALQPVREKLVREQQRIGNEVAAHGGGVVLDGRDIGTIVFPDAEVKVFLIADPVERAVRRQAELSGKGQAATVEEVLAEIVERDRRDMNRALGPLRKAEDAVEIDTTALSIEDQVRIVFDKVRERCGDYTV